MKLYNSFRAVHMKLLVFKLSRMILVIAVMVCLISFSQHTACMSICEAGNSTYIQENKQNVQLAGSEPGPGLYLNLNYPAPCSGLITGYSYCYRLDTAGMFKTSFSLWSCQDNKNCRKINKTEDFMIMQNDPDSIKCGNHSSEENHRIGRGNVLGAQIVPESGADFAVTDGNAAESFCFFEDDSNSDKNCSGLNMRNGFLFISVNIDPDSCNAPRIPENGFAHDANSMQPVNTSDTYQFESVIKFSCIEGYKIDGFSVIICDSQWNPEPPMCIPRECESPGELQNGTIQGNVFTFPSIVTFSCLEGFELNETINAIQCDATGVWNSSIPVCIRVNCGDPGIPARGTRDGDRFDFESELIFRCNENLVLRGQSILQCGSNGDWDADIPACVNTDQSTVIIASTISVFSIFIALLAFVLGITIGVCYQKYRKRKNKINQFASREDLVYNCAYESRNDSKMDFKPNTSYGMRPKSEHLYDVIPGDRFASLKSQHREAMENSYSHCTIVEQ